MCGRAALQRRRHTLTVDTKAALSALTRKAPDFGAPSGSFKARWQRGQAVASLASTPIKSIKSPRVRAAEKATVAV